MADLTTSGRRNSEKMEMEREYNKNNKNEQAYESAQKVSVELTKQNRKKVTVEIKERV